MSEISQRTRAQAASAGAITLLGPLVLGVFALAALALLRRAVERLAALLAYAYPHDSLEGTLLYEARLLWSGEPLYQPLELHRFVAAPYPPVHPLLLGLFDQIAGAHVFWGGRLLSLAAALGVAILIVLLVRRVAGSWLAGLLGAALFLCTGPALLWATRVKPDMLALLWTALGLYLATGDRMHETGDTRQETRDGAIPALLSPVSRSLVLHLAALCFALAAFTKQTAVAAPLAVGLALLITDVRAFRAGMHQGYVGRLPLRRRTLVFGLTYLGLLLAGWLLLDVIAHGQFSFHVWVMHRRASWSPQLMWKFVSLLAPYWPAMLLALALLARAMRNERVLVLAIYALLAPLTLLGAGKTGANHNHLLETLLALALAVGVAAGWATRRAETGDTRHETRDTRYEIRDTRHHASNLTSHVSWSLVSHVVRIASIALIATQLALAFRPQEWYLGELEPKDPPERFLVFIRNTPGEILADDVGLLFMADKPLRYDDPTGMGPVIFGGLWDQRGLIEDIQQRRFSAIMLPMDIEPGSIDPAGHWTPEMLATVYEHYRIEFRDRINTYIPK